jgi:hypothetical protein
MRIEIAQVNWTQLVESTMRTTILSIPETVILESERMHQHTKIWDLRQASDVLHGTCILVHETLVARVS